MNYSIPMMAVVGLFAANAVCHGQKIVGHRGASHDAPENTLVAFRLAWEQGADAIEGDFYLTKDNEIVCIHDKSTKRTAAKLKGFDVAKSTLAELRKVDVGSWKGKQFKGERIPTLAEVLATVPEDKGIFIEIKCGPEIVPHLQKQLKSTSLAADQITIICFNEEVISQCRNSMPQYKANWLTSYNRSMSLGAWTPKLKDVLKRLKECNATGLGSKGNRNVITPSFAKALDEAGFELHVWTINKPADAKYFSELGVQSITTDKPAEIRKSLK